MTQINPGSPYNPQPQQTNTKTTGSHTTKTVHVSRELDGVNNTGVIGEWLTVGTQHLADANRFFVKKFRINHLLEENLRAVNTASNLVKGGQGQKILCADDMYVAGDPQLGGKKNGYQPVEVLPPPGYYTMFKDGADNARGVSINSHVDVINDQGNTAFTEYGFIVKDDAGQQYKASLSGGELLISEPNGGVVRLQPPDGLYVVGDPNDPVAKFSYQNVPGGANNTDESRLSFEYFEKPTAQSVQTLVSKGVPQAQAEAMRSRFQSTFGFRIPDGGNTYRASAGISGDNPALKVTQNGVKTYYDTHFYEGPCTKLEICEPNYEPPPYCGGDDGGGYGDPHFRGFDAAKDAGWQYDVMGEPGKTYNILSDQNIQVNAKFDEWSGPKATIMSEVGIQVANRENLNQIDRLYFDARNDDKSRATSAPKLNDKPMEANKRYTLADGGWAEWDGKHSLAVVSDEYSFDLNRRDSQHGGLFDIEARISDGANPFGDFVGGHGILGQTAHGRTDEVRQGDRGAGAQGGGALDTIQEDGSVTLSSRGDKTVHKDYETADLWSTTGNQFNRFGAEVGLIHAADTDGDGVNDTVVQVIDKNNNIVWGNLYERLAPPLPAETAKQIIQDVQKSMATPPAPQVIPNAATGGLEDAVADEVVNIPEPVVKPVAAPKNNTPATPVTNQPDKPTTTAIPPTPPVANKPAVTQPVANNTSPANTGADATTNNPVAPPPKAPANNNVKADGAEQTSKPAKTETAQNTKQNQFQLPADQANTPPQANNLPPGNPFEAMMKMMQDMFQQMMAMMASFFPKS